MNDDKEYQIQRLSAALDVSGKTIKSMEVKLKTMQDLVVRMEHEKRNWEQQKISQEMIIKNQLQFSDQEKEKLQGEIIELRREIKELKSA
jgi:CO/xanthine dehydrogenase FAD-binding subunit